MGYPGLPKIRGFTWRAIEINDAGVLQKFGIECSHEERATQVDSLDSWREKLASLNPAARNSLIAISEHGKIAAVGWIQYSPGAEQVRAFLDGRVHPDYRCRGIGTALLGWMEDKASEHLQKIAEGRSKVLRIMFYNRPAEAIKLFEALGFIFMYAEEEMRYHLQGQALATAPLPGISIETWKPEIARDFYKVYKDAFQTRTDNLMSEAAWTFHFANPEEKDFDPKYSLLLREAGEPIAYTVCHIEDTDQREQPYEPWITQMSVRQAWRRRGIATGLLMECMRRMREAGFAHTMLSVNVNNPEARSVYERLGFSLTRRLTMYTKELEG